MIGLLVTGHANFGTGITSSVNLIVGEQEAYRAVDFLPTYSTEDLTQEISKAIDDLKDCEGIIIFTDLMGGTPFNVSAQLGRKRTYRITDRGRRIYAEEVERLRRCLLDAEEEAHTAL